MRALLIALVCLVVVGLTQGAGLRSRSTEARIVGGNEVPGNAPYEFIVALRNKKGKQFCGGSLIHPQWVLTAAHCVAGEVDTVQIGVYDFDGAKKRDNIYDVAATFAHPRYYRVTDDIALVKLTKPVSSGSGARLIKVSPQRGQSPQEDEGRMLKVIGWGYTSHGSGVSMTKLRQVNVPINTARECSNAYGGYSRSDNLCAGFYDVGGKDSCSGDSGGPLFYERGNDIVQVGIVAYGFGCAKPGYPGLYTRGSSYVSWMESTIRDRLPSDREIENFNGASSGPVETTKSPTQNPTKQPTKQPTKNPTAEPTEKPRDDDETNGGNNGDGKDPEPEITTAPAPSPSAESVNFMDRSVWNFVCDEKHRLSKAGRTNAYQCFEECTKDANCKRFAFNLGRRECEFYGEGCTQSDNEIVENNGWQLFDLDFLVANKFSAKKTKFTANPNTRCINTRNTNVIPDAKFEGAPVSECESHCRNHPYCAAFVINDLGNCVLYHSCFTESEDKDITAYIR